MISSVGHDATTTCSSIRAGLSRPSELDFGTLDEDMIPVRVMGHPIDSITNGYYFIGRWLRLAERAVADLINNIGSVESDLSFYWEKAGLIVVIPDTVDRYLITVPIDDEYIVRKYVEKILQLSNINIALKQVKIIRKGHAGTAAAIKLAIDSFELDIVNHFLVLAVDSYVEVTSLSWLSGCGRLKLANQPAGLMPGEAAACFLVGRREFLSPNSKNSGLQVLGVELSSDPKFENFDSPNPGRVLANTVEKLLKDLAIPLPFSGDIFVDLNGENWRAREFGVALSSLKKEIFSSNISIMTLCTEIGETGVVSGSAALCMAAHAYNRHYSSSNVTLIISQSEDGVVGVTCVDKI